MRLKIILALLAVSAFLPSCEEDDLFGFDQGEQEVELTKSLINAQARAIGIYNLVDIVYRDPIFRNLDSTSLEGAKATRVGNTTTIDFGQGGSGSDGTLRAGAIVLTNTSSGPNDFLQSGTKLDGQFNNYRVDGSAVKGSFVFENLGNEKFSLDFQDFSVEDSTRYISTQQIQWQTGFSTFVDPRDDRYAIDGNAELTDSTTTYKVSSSISASPLVFSRVCEYGIEQGIKDLSFTGDSLDFDQGSLDFIPGDTCNNVLDISLSSGDGSELTLPLTFSGF